MKDGKKGYYVVIKRRNIDDDEHHGGGAWKIAYSDFMTTLMAFFMLLWLLNSTPSDDLKRMADYFKSSKIGIFDSMFNEKTGESDEEDGKADSADNSVKGNEDTRTGALSEDDNSSNSFFFGRREDASGNSSANINLIKRDLKNLIEGDAVIEKLKDNIDLSETSEGLCFTISDSKDGNIFFDNSAIITREGMHLLKAIAPTIKRSNSFISIRGYFGSSADSNAKISASSQCALANERANAARSVLESDGVDSAIIASLVSYAAVQSDIIEKKGGKKKIDVLILKDLKKTKRKIK